MPTVSNKLNLIASTPPLRLGFLPLTDAAPLIVAERRGLFTQHGLKVQLQREIGWATIREKVIYGEFDAAHAPAPLLWSTRAGLDCAACDVITGLVLSVGGHGVTLSRALWDAGVRDAASIVPYLRDRRRRLPLTFGVSSFYSATNLALLSWLKTAGVNAGKEVRIIVVPPAQIVRHLAAGTVDGYCASEPWNSLALRDGAGWCPSWQANRSTGMAEKVLLTTARFAKNRANEHRILIAALAEACAWCDEPHNREPLAELLAETCYLNVSRHDIAPGLLGYSEPGHGNTCEPIHFARHEANVPSLAKAQSLQNELVDSGVIPVTAATSDVPRRVFREELYREAVGTHPGMVQAK